MEESDTSIIISDQVTVNKTTTPLTLTADGKLRWTDRGQRCLTVEKQVLGFVIEGTKIRIKAILDKEDVISCGGTTDTLIRNDFVFQPQNEESQRVLCHHLRDYLDSLARPKRLLIFVNPFGGKKSASKIFVDDVKPLLEDADVQITVQETKHQLHAKEVTRGLDLSKYDGIVCVSGDGVLVEVVNGLLAREDWRDAIKMPLGMVPAGTSNGMAKSLLDSVGEPCKASNAVLSIIRGHRRSLDVATVLQGETKFFSVLMFSWGMIADIDIESEKYRWMGSARMDFYALQRIIHLRHYNGCIAFVPAPGYESYGEPITYSSVSPSNSEQPLKIQHGYPGPDVDLNNFDWRMISGPFVSVWLHNVPWGGEDVMAAPHAKDCPKLSLLAMMTGLKNGDHIKSPYVIYLKVKAFILEPGPRVDDPAKGGIIDVDGEVLCRGNGSYKCDQKTLMNYDKLQLTIDQGLATLFSPL
ncbi:sphingosine kinase 1 isoform X2 [Mercurialis annua]|uniref:sphingosine kinase 1 isoform X2 n=1 Tax=Mercurialis annua TaxID=3986 RepID=UPI00216087CD|nr:sphingosine kinase 1 isoform X2 [Mercurialis annua]